MDKLKIGIIGLGMGRAHLVEFIKHPQAVVTAIADHKDSYLNEVGDQFGIPRRYKSGEEMIEKEKLDVVSIVTPNKFHKSLTLAAFAAGCHVLCEKPMAMNTSEAQEMLEASKRYNRRLMINFSSRFNEASQAAKAHADSGALGDVYFSRSIYHRRRGIPKIGGWFGQKELAGGGPLIDLGVHRLDLALWLMGFPNPLWVLSGAYYQLGAEIAHRQKARFDVEDLAVAFIRFDNGATLELEASWAANIKEAEVMETRLLGTQGGLVQRYVEESHSFETEAYFEKDGSQYDLRLHPLGQRSPSSYYHFVDCIVNDRPHTGTAEEGVQVMKILDAVYQSAREAKPVLLVE